MASLRVDTPYQRRERIVTHSTKIEIQPVAEALGAEISNVDLSDDLDESVIANIRGALLNH